MNNIGDCYTYTALRIRKQFSGSLSPIEWNLYAPVCQDLHFLEKMGLTQKYSIGLGYPASGQRRSTVIMRETPQELEASQLLSDAMRNFLSTGDTIITGVNNIFTLPSDYVAYRSARYLRVWQELDFQTGQNITKFRWTPIEYVTGATFDYRLYAYVKKPTIEYPIGTYDNGALKIAADPVMQVVVPPISLSYAKLPPDPKFGFTVNASDQAIYDPNTSVDFSFPKIEWEQICIKLVTYWAEMTGEDTLTAETQSQTKTGE